MHLLPMWCHYWTLWLDFGHHFFSVESRLHTNAYDFGRELKYWDALKTESCGLKVSSYGRVWDGSMNNILFYKFNKDYCLIQFIGRQIYDLIQFVCVKNNKTHWCILDPFFFFLKITIIWHINLVYQFM